MIPSHPIGSVIAFADALIVSREAFVDGSEDVEGSAGDAVSCG